MHGRSIVAWCALLLLALPGSVRAQNEQATPVVADTVRTVEVTAAQFRFVPSQIEVVQGETVQLRIRSVDVAHGLAIPEFGVRVMVRPGQDATVEFVADTPGSYPFQCNVFCGAGHGRMVGTLVVLPATGQTAMADSTDSSSTLVDPLEPDFSLVSLPTTLELPTNRLAFRLVHRFSRPLDGGIGHGNLLEDFFGLDSAAMIGFELRYGLAPGLQVGVHRNNTRNIQLFGRYSLLQSPTGTDVDAIVSIEGLDNFRDEHSPSFGAVVSQRLGSVGALYVEPMWVENVDNGVILHPQTDPFTKTDDDAFVLGLGARLRILETVSLVGEYMPRVSGFDQGEDYIGLGIEKQAGGHVFQLNVSNSIGTTPSQLAQGGGTSWFIGFNITRRFY